MARKRTNFDVGNDTQPLRVRSTAELNAPADEPSDLLSAWQGRTRGLAEQPAAAQDRDSAALFAQLRTIADDLAQPVSNAPPRLLSAGDQVDAPHSALAGERSLHSGSEGAYPAPQVDLSLLREYIDSAERRLASIIADSQRLVADGLRESRDRMAEIVSAQPSGNPEPPHSQVDSAALSAAITEGEARLSKSITETIATSMTASQESLAAELRSWHGRMTSVLESNHAPVEVGLVALLEALESVERRVSGTVSERHERAVERHNQLVDEIRSWHGNLATLLQSTSESRHELMKAVRAEGAEASDAVRKLETDINRSHTALHDTIASSEQSLTSAIARLESAFSKHIAQLDEGKKAEIAGVVDQIADVKSFVQTQVGAIAEQTRGLNEQLSTAEVSRLPALFHELRTDLEVSEAELLAAAAREEQVRADATRRESEMLEAANAAALQRAIGMLSVLESLDDVVAGLQGRSDSESLNRLQHFERETRAMAKLVELEDIPAEGVIDPARHEVVSTVSGSAPAGTIVDLLQRGYTFRGRVVRPAQVIAAE